MNGISSFSSFYFISSFAVPLNCSVPSTYTCHIRLQDKEVSAFFSLQKQDCRTLPTGMDNERDVYNIILSQSCTDLIIIQNGNLQRECKIASVHLK